VITNQKVIFICIAILNVSIICILCDFESALEHVCRKGRHSFVRFLLDEQEGFVTDNPQKTLVISFMKLFLYMQPLNGHHLMNTTDMNNIVFI